MSIYASCQPRRVQPAGVFVLWLAWRSSTLVRTEFLQEVYKRADISKPLSLIGLARGLPVDEMEKLLLAGILVNHVTMQALALQRGVAVNPGKTEAKADAKTETK